jgi:hypothetical protein
MSRCSFKANALSSYENHTTGLKRKAILGRTEPAAFFALAAIDYQMLGLLDFGSKPNVGNFLVQAAVPVSTGRCCLRGCRVWLLGNPRSGFLVEFPSHVMLRILAPVPISEEHTKPA